jgi:hypothetical protein
MFAIGKYARALPSLLDLKERGKGPNQFSEQVVGTVDLTQLYLLQGRETINTVNNAAPAVGQNSWGTPLLVPANEVWFVHHYLATSQVGAGAAVDLATSMNPDGTAGFMLGDYVAGAATQNVRARASLPFIATPGTELTFLVRSVTLAPSIAGALLVTKLKV